MDWKLAIKRNRDDLREVAAGLLAMVGKRQVLPRPVYRTVLGILRPAEAALRRLIVVFAAVLNVRTAARAANAASNPLPDFATFNRGNAAPAFALIDPRKPFGTDDAPAGSASGVPRISVPGILDPAKSATPAAEPGVTAIHRRIAALDHALKTLPAQARRLMRLMARRNMAKPGPGRTGPIRPGTPPGHRQRHVHPVDEILHECHLLARDCETRPP